jgi:hypothetical protein
MSRKKKKNTPRDIKACFMLAYKAERMSTYSDKLGNHINYGKSFTSLKFSKWNLICNCGK